MKKKNIKKTPTNSNNLEGRFDNGESVLDFFKIKSDSQRFKKKLTKKNNREKKVNT